MGRYVFFNTGLEYKFAFGCQSSQDILLFEGLGNYRGFLTSSYFEEEDYVSPYHEWKQEDKEKILNRLSRIAKELNAELVDFDIYQKNLEGTTELKDAIENQIQEKGETFYLYLLGCLIYHQLLYKNVLTCHYES